VAHQLWPPEGAPFLSVDEVLRRWRETFAHVVADPAAGRAHMDETIAYLAGMVGGNQYFTPEDLERACRNRDLAVHVRLADAADASVAYLETVITPESEIFFDYTGGDHEDAAAPLVERAAASLGYESELV
jgi:hypothetical protein